MRIPVHLAGLLAIVSGCLPAADPPVYLGDLIREALEHNPEILAAQKKVAEEMQRQWFVEVPMVQTGQWMLPTAHRSDVTDLAPGFAVFWNVRRSA